MTGLDVFALIVLFVLLVAGAVALVAIGMLPGRIARQRGHPQAEAINVCGWMGLITFGVLLPLAYIWAFTNPNPRGAPPAAAAPASRAEGQQEAAS